MSGPGFVFDFDEPRRRWARTARRQGGRARRDDALGLPVPAGFTITTDACRAYMAAGDLPDGLEDEVAEHVAPAGGEDRQAVRRSGRPAARLGALGRRRFDAGDDGHDPQPRPRTTPRSRGSPRAPATGGSPRLVPAADPDVRRGGRRDRRAPVRGRARRAEARPRGRRTTPISPPTTSQGSSTRSARSTARRRASEFPPTATGQLMRAVRAVFDSWDTPRAQVYRRANDIPDDLGTAVNVVQMVFGNKGERSGTGVAFTRNPSTGEKEVYGEFLANAQGEDVVAGIRTPQPVESMRRDDAGGLRAAARDAAPARGALPRHAGHRVHGRGRRALHAPDARRRSVPPQPR